MQARWLLTVSAVLAWVIGAALARVRRAAPR
jgi:hypothetical protein